MLLHIFIDYCFVSHYKETINFSNIDTISQLQHFSTCSSTISTTSTFSTTSTSSWQRSTNDFDPWEFHHPLRFYGYCQWPNEWHVSTHDRIALWYLWRLLWPLWCSISPRHNALHVMMNNLTNSVVKIWQTTGEKSFPMYVCYHCRQITHSYS